MLMTEHAGKCLLKAHGVPVPTGILIRQSGHVQRWGGAYPVALKAQVSSGGRGKAGGVVRASTSEQAEAAAQQLFEREFGGESPASLLMEPWVEHSRELYLAVTVDGQSGGYVILYASSGGVDVEHQAPHQYAFGSRETLERTSSVRCSPNLSRTALCGSASLRSRAVFYSSLPRSMR